MTQTSPANDETVQSAPAGARGFDTDTQLTSNTAAAFAAAGFRFAVRYLSLGPVEQSGDLTASEVQDIVGAGLALMAVQHAPESGWIPTAQLGEQHGNNAARNAQSAGLPSGMNIWLDLEGVNSGAPASNVSAYCNAWFSKVADAGYVPGLYVGTGSILSGEQLDALEVNYFWKSGCDAGAQDQGSCFEYSYPMKGYCMVQSISGSASLDNVAYDFDVIQQDNCSETPHWLAAQKHRPLLGHLPVLHEPEIPKALATPAKQSRVAMMLGIAAAALLLYCAGAVTGRLVLQKLGASAGRFKGLAGAAKAVPQNSTTPAAIAATPLPGTAPPSPAGLNSTSQTGQVTPAVETTGAHSTNGATPTTKASREPKQQDPPVAGAEQQSPAEPAP
jgi:hypothetical protein